MSKLVPTADYLLKRISVFEDGDEVAEGLEWLVEDLEQSLGAYHLYYAKESVVHLEGVTDLLMEMKLFLKHLEKKK